MCIHCRAISPTFPNSLTFRQNLFCPPLQLCWREDIRDNKKDKAYLLFWDKDSYTERFLALFPCTCVLQPNPNWFISTRPLHYFTTSQSPIVTSVSLRLLYLLLYSRHIKHFQVLVFLPFPWSSCTHSLLSVWPMSNNITAFVLGLKSAYEGEHMIFGLVSQANFDLYDVLQFNSFTCEWLNLILLCGWVKLHYV
jgi:hypothetical protein